MAWLNLLFWMSLPAILFDVFHDSTIKRKDGQQGTKDIGNIYQNYNHHDTSHEMGKRVFYASCYSCHNDSANTLAPGYTMLTTMTPRAILASLNQGKMKLQASNLSDEERKAVSEWLTRSKLKSTEFQKEAFHFI
jgi:cytochrome c553